MLILQALPFNPPYKVIRFNNFIMIQNPNNSYKKLPNLKLYSLSIYDIEFAPDIRKAYAYFTFSVYGLDDLLIKESPILYGNTHQTWSLIINLPTPKVTFYSQQLRGNKRKYQLGQVFLEMSKNHMSVFSVNKKLICQINYEIQQKNQNSFKNNSNIFDDVAEQRPLRVHNKIHHPTLDITYERKMYYDPDSKILQLSAEEQEEYNMRQGYEDERTVIKKVGEASRLLQDSMKNSEEERRLFSKYLDDSTSYINELMSQLEQKPILENSKFEEISAIHEEKNESDQELRTQQKWYKRKFNKNYLKSKSQLRKPKNMKNSLDETTKINVVFLDEKNQRANVVFKIIGDFVIDSKEKVKQIVLSDEDKVGKKVKDIVKISRSDGSWSNQWPIQIPLASNNSINIRCQSDKYQYVGCIGKNEQKIGQCELFDANGVLKGMILFKSKCVNEIFIQTQELLPSQIQENNSEPLNPPDTPRKETPQNMITELSPPAIEENVQVEKRQSFYKKLASQAQLSPIKALSVMSSHQLGTGEKDSEKNQQVVRNPKILMDTKETQKPQYIQSEIHLKQDISFFQNNSEEKQQWKETIEKSSEIPNKLNLNLQNLKNQQVPEQANKESHRLYESQAIHLNFISPRSGKINLKLNNIDVRLDHPNHHGKFLKIEMSTQPIPYYTETSSQVCFLNWKGKGYFFLNIPKTSILNLELIEEAPNQMNVLGKCKIHLNLLNTQYLGINSYEDFLRDQSQQSIGKIILEFQFFQKNTSDLSSIVTKFNTGRKTNKTKQQQIKPGKQQSERDQNLYSRLVESTVQREKPQPGKKKASHIRIKSQSKGRYSKNIELHDHVFDQLIQKDPSKSSVKIRKYVGGNIIIPKAARFKTSQGEGAGPGAYEYQSQFQRHAIVQ